MHYLLTLFYVHINAMGIALWKEQNNSGLKEVLHAFSIEWNQGNTTPVKKLLQKK